jgi:nucleolar protein 15
MSSSLKKVKKLSKTKTKQAPAAVDVVIPSLPASLSKERKSKPAKAEEHVPKTLVKVKEEGTKRTMQSLSIASQGRPKDAKRAKRLVRKGPGPWKPPSPSPSPSPPSDFEPSQSEEDEPEAPQEDNNSTSEEENVHLYGFSTDVDSSDDDLDVGEDADFDVGALPTVARDDASVKRRLQKAKLKPVRVPLLVLLPSRREQRFIMNAFQATETGVVYLGRIPHGFYEEQMRAYFSQFGDISRLRLSRNKKVRVP